MKQMSNFIDFEQELIILKQNTEHTAKITLCVLTRELEFSFVLGGVTYSRSVSYSDCLHNFRPNILDKVKHCQELMKEAYGTSGTGSKLTYSG